MSQIRVALVFAVLAAAAPAGAESCPSAVRAFADGDYESAITAWRACLPSDPDPLVVHLNIATAYARLYDFDEAFRFVDKAERAAEASEEDKTIVAARRKALRDLALATHLVVRVDSVPQGATVYRNDGSEPIGLTPFAGWLPRSTTAVRFDHPERGESVATVELDDVESVHIQQVLAEAAMAPDPRFAIEEALAAKEESEPLLIAGWATLSFAVAGAATATAFAIMEDDALADANRAVSRAGFTDISAVQQAELRAQYNDHLDRRDQYRTGMIASSAITVAAATASIVMLSFHYSAETPTRPAVSIGATSSEAQLQFTLGF